MTWAVGPDQRLYAVEAEASTHSRQATRSVCTHAELYGQPNSSVMAGSRHDSTRLVCDGGSQALVHDFLELVHVVGDAAARAAQREGWPDESTGKPISSRVQLLCVRLHA